ncbi:MAG: hypothetical protein ACOZBZ_00665 [Patescibacteria group bacterium]
MDKERKIIELVEVLEKQGNRAGAAVLELLGDVAIQRFEPGGKEKVGNLSRSFQACLKERVPLEMIREVVRLART